MLIQLHAMSQLCGHMIDSVEAMFRERALYKFLVAEVSPNACESGESVFIRFEIDIDDRVALAQKAPLENTAKEPGSASDENMGHGQF